MWCIMQVAFMNSFTEKHENLLQNISCTVSNDCEKKEKQMVRYIILFFLISNHFNLKLDVDDKSIMFNTKAT